MKKVYDYYEEKHKKVFFIAMVSIAIFYAIWFAAQLGFDTSVWFVEACLVIWCIAGLVGIINLVKVFAMRLIQRAVMRSGKEELIKILNRSDTCNLNWLYCFDRKQLTDDTTIFRNAKVVRCGHWNFLYSFDHYTEGGDRTV